VSNRWRWSPPTPSAALPQTMTPTIRPPAAVGSRLRDLRQHDNKVRGMKPRGPDRTENDTVTSDVPRGTPFERQLVLGSLALALVAVPIFVGYFRSRTGLNDIACAIAIGALLPLASRAERWFAQPTMIVGGWLIASAFLFHHTSDVSVGIDFLVGSLVVMASTNGSPGSHLRSIGGGRGPSWRR
jgi:hypothetical protein